MNSNEINQLIREATGINRNDFDSDLNACHEMEKVLGQIQKIRYAEMVRELTDKTSAWTNFNLAHATAAQRCEAFCRVMWPERWKGKA